MAKVAAAPVAESTAQATVQAQSVPTFDPKFTGQQVGWVAPPHESPQMALGIDSSGVSPQEGTITLPAPEEAVESLPSIPVTDKLNFDRINEIEDPVVKSMALMFQTVGGKLDVDRVMGNAIRLSNPDLIDVAYITEHGGKNAPQLIEMAKGIVEGVQKQAQQFENAVYSLVGGKQHWDVAVGVFNSKAPQDIKEAVARMLDSRDAVLIKQGAKMVAEYGQQAGFMPQLGHQVQAFSAGSPQNQSLSKEDFQRAIRKLAGSVDSRTPEYQEQVAKLLEKRRVGYQLGI